MELTQLHYFAVLAQVEHMTRAAGQLHIAQPALTRSIRRLEQELGVQLVAPKGRGIALTPCGRLLADRLAVPLAQLDALPAQLQSFAAGGSRRVHLAVLAASAAVTEAVIAYQTRCPDVTFTVAQHQAGADWDVCVSTCADGGGQTLGEPAPAQAPLSEEILLAVPARSPFASDSIRLEQARAEGFICLAGSRQFRSICDRFCHRAGFAPRVVFESDSPATVRGLIAVGSGVGFWPAASWGSPGSGVRLLRMKDQVCRRALLIERAATCQPQDAATDFADFLQDFLARRLRPDAPEE